MPVMLTMAGWQSGYAAACKAVYAGSIPASASSLIFSNFFTAYIQIFTSNIL